MKKMKRTSILLIALYFTAMINLNGQVDEADSLAMVDLYNSLNGDDWTDNTNWLSEKPIREWYGIFEINGRITNIDMPNNNCVGSIANSLGNVDSLKILFMPENHISSFAVLDSFHFLKTIDLANNLLTTFPEFIFKSKNLERLNLFSNAISGNIPAALNNLTELKEMYISENELSGFLPDLKALKKLEVLGLSLNPLLRGNLNQMLYDTLPLENLDISYSGISGSLIPSYFSRINSLYLFGDSSKVTEVSMLDGFNISRAWFRNTDLGFGELVDLVNNNTINQYNYNPQNLVDGPQDIISSIGTDISLNCNIDNADALQWYKDGEEIAGADGVELSITISSMDDEGYYHCTGTNTTLPQLTMNQSSTLVSLSTTNTEEHNSQEITLYPNPADQYISINGLPSEYKSVEIFNRIGQNMNSTFNSGNNTAHIGDLIPGYYVLKYTPRVNGKPISIPFVKE